MAWHRNPQYMIMSVGSVWEIPVRSRPGKRPPRSPCTPPAQSRSSAQAKSQHATGKHSCLCQYVSPLCTCRMVIGPAASDSASCFFEDARYGIVGSCHMTLLSRPSSAMHCGRGGRGGVEGGGGGGGGVGGGGAGARGRGTPD
jgi:hypothetical protein